MQIDVVSIIIGIVIGWLVTCFSIGFLGIDKGHIKQYPQESKIHPKHQHRNQD
jgi:hypothetical protein